MPSLTFASRKRTIPVAHGELPRIVCPLTYGLVPLEAGRAGFAAHPELLFVLDASAGLYRHVRGDLAERMAREAHGVLATHPSELEALLVDRTDLKVIEVIRGNPATDPSASILILGFAPAA